MATQWVRDIGSLYNFIGYVVLGAPNRFPREDYLADDEQMTLDKAFEELRRGASLAGQGHPDSEFLEKLNQVLDEALVFYRGGDKVRGAHRVQDFQDLIFKQSASLDNHA